jgi:hypothetical protein
MDTTGRLVRDLLKQGLRDRALMAWIEALDSHNQTTIWRWDDVAATIVRHGGLGEGIVEHAITWREGSYVPRVPEYRVVVGSQAHDFNTPLGAATFIVTGRDVTERPLSYEISVREVGKQPEVEPIEVVGLDEAIDVFIDEVDLTTGRGAGYIPRAEVRTVVRSGVAYTHTAKTPTGVPYIHQIGRL